MTSRELRQKIKLYFSSLFSRKMPYLIIGAPALSSTNSLLYTNMTLEQAAVYEPSTDYFIHKVHIKDAEFNAALHSVFPVITNTVMFIDLPCFLGMLNKHPTLDMSTFVMSFYGDNITLSSTDADTPESVVCGTVLSETQANDFYLLYNMPQPTQMDVKLNMLDYNDLTTEKFSLLRIKNKAGGADFCFVYLDGRTSVSSKEFISKQIDNTYKWYGVFDPTSRAGNIVYKFESADVDVSSTQPAMIWYL